MNMREKPKTPAIAISIWVTGWLAIGVGAIATVATFVEPSGPFVALGAVASGVMLVGFGSIVDRLSRIEHHLRGQTDT